MHICQAAIAQAGLLAAVVERTDLPMLHGAKQTARPRLLCDNVQRKELQQETGPVGSRDTPANTHENMNLAIVRQIHAQLRLSTGRAPPVYAAAACTEGSLALPASAASTGPGHAAPESAGLLPR